MKSHRIERLQNEIKKILNQTLSTRLNDSRMEWIIISDVILSKDMSYLKVYFTHYNNPQSHEKVKGLLDRASGFFKKQIAGAQLMRTIPEITFYYDETEERASRVESLLASAKDDFDDEDDDYDPDIDLDDYLDDDDIFEYDEDDDDLDNLDEIDEDEEK